MTHDGLIILQGGRCSEFSWETHRTACVHDWCHTRHTHACLSGRRHCQHLKVNLEAPLRLARLADDQHFVLSEPDQDLVREVHPLQVVQRRAVHRQPAPPAQVLDGEQHVRAVWCSVCVEGQLFAGHPRVDQGEGAGLVVSPQPEGVICRVSAPVPQRKQLVKALRTLERVVNLDVETREEILFCLNCLRHIHSRNGSLLQISGE